jgi:probable rRNA maturation factor
MNPRIIADIEVVCEAADVPSIAETEDWLERAFAATGSERTNDTEVSVRVVDEAESQALNLQYRGMDRSTNVLAFPVDLPNFDHWPEHSAMPLGDLVICAPVVAREATEQGKDPAAHWGHMLVHGMLHLLGYDHGNEADALAMESLESRILGEKGVQNPYEDA